MYVDEVFSLWCLVDGESKPFTIVVNMNNTMDELRREIKLEKKALGGVDTSDLALWKLNDPVLVKPDSTLATRIGSLGTNSSVVLESTDTVSDVFPRPPSKKHLYVIVKRPDDTRPSKVPSAPSSASLRRETVAALYQRLNTYRFIQVRGTPASGKTVLGQLLAAHISRQEPDVHIVWVYGWPKESGDYHKRLKKLGWKENKKTVFIFDEGQMSYVDARLWGEFFKSMHDHQERRAIVFASYGSPTSRLIFQGHPPIIVPDPQRVTLCHVPHEDGLPSAGLLFTRSEFNDLVINHYPSPDFYFDSSFFDKLFDITNGHVGAIHDFTRMIIADGSYRNFKLDASQLYTWDLLLAKVSPRELLRKLEGASIFGRGLPTNMALQDPATAGIFSAVLRMGVVKDADVRTEDEKSALQACFHNGWLHADKLGVINLPDNVGYFFPSSLHRWYVEWKLLDSLPPIQLQANCLLDFVIDAIRLFSPRLLSAERRIGPGCTQRLPEAQYQDELYRCCHTLSEGSLITFPEFGTAKGRVDFFIPAKTWGIELLRDGNQLARHCGRFSQTGSYGTMFPLSEYIIIDCRTTHPKEQHPCKWTRFWPLLH
ncbi:hypothetical protein M378DRAFT_905153 [Amanita muscaria Koide BX008]|uniref:Crinkler effector protein N-terminal domain-containing protein n=1 Tax=Amanita muscaria (strain Koide BX008) TaxID=946122 RepID=A0A0C2WH91_AMAMK|nr:hypothetical protein M378DRAFT_905153 [Amanita muscaria Koide BX008]